MRPRAALEEPMVSCGEIVLDPASYAAATTREARETYPVNGWFFMVLVLLFGATLAAVPRGRGRP
jgi:hypothetical protein